MGFNFGSSEGFRVGMTVAAIPHSGELNVSTIFCNEIVLQQFRCKTEGVGNTAPWALKDVTGIFLPYRWCRKICAPARLAKLQNLILCLASHTNRVQTLLKKIALSRYSPQKLRVKSIESYRRYCTLKTIFLFCSPLIRQIITLQVWADKSELPFLNQRQMTRQT